MTKQKNKNRKRTLSRLIAVQILYQHDFNKGEKPYEEIKNELVENYILNSDEEISSYKDEIDAEFLTQLLGVTQIFSKIDGEISVFLQKDWTVRRLDPVLLQILRLAIFELQMFTDIPPRVVIDEYVSIAASFF